MLPYTGDYIEHNDGDKSDFTYYTFTPRPLADGDLYKMDDELAALLIDAHQNLAFLEGLIKYAPNKSAFSELMLLKECTYSRMIDYSSPSFHEVLISRGNGKSDVTPIRNLTLAYRTAKDKLVAAQDLSELCGIALYGEDAKSIIDVRQSQTYLLNVKNNLKMYNPTAPEQVLPALADISAYLYNNRDTDVLIKAALVHFQFEMIHPFEKYNGIMGRILISMLLRNVVDEALPVICISEFLYSNKNEYFDLLKSTQYSGGYIRWIKFFVKAISKAANQTAELMIQYEHTIAEDEDLLKFATKSARIVYNYLKDAPVTSVITAEKQTGLSFNTVSKAIIFLQKKNIVNQYKEQGRNRLFGYEKIDDMLSE